MAFARHQFELREPQEDGSPLIAHLEAAWRQSGVKPETLAEAPLLPPACEGLWRGFLELHACRCSGGMGPSRITYMDIDAYQRVTGMKFDPWELEAIRQTDAAILSDHEERRAKE